MQPKQFRTAQWTHSSTNGTGLRKGRNAEERRNGDFWQRDPEGCTVVRDESRIELSEAKIEELVDFLEIQTRQWRTGGEASWAKRSNGGETRKGHNAKNLGTR